MGAAPAGDEPLDLDAIAAELRARDAQLRERVGELAKPPERGAELGFGKRIGDGTTEAVSRLTDVGVGHDLEARELRVRRALAKLDEGTYGVCDVCAGPIERPRLRAMPESVLCIACARAAG